MFKLVLTISFVTFLHATRAGQARPLYSLYKFMGQIVQLDFTVCCVLQWNLSIVDTIRTGQSVLIIKKVYILISEALNPLLGLQLIIYYKGVLIMECPH